MTTFWTSGFDYNKCYINGDTVIQQKDCKIYHRTHQTCDFRSTEEYLYEEDNKWYYFDTLVNGFMLLYDFSAEQGDTLTFPFWYGLNYFDSLFYIRIDSIDFIQFDTINLKRFYVTYDTYDDITINFPENYNKGIIIEGIGSLWNFFHFSENGACDWRYNVGLRCFSNPILGTIKFRRIECDSALTSSNEIKSVNDLININPNPFNDKIFITSSMDVSRARIIAYDLDGRLVYKTEVNLINNQRIELDIENLHSNMYIFTVFDSNYKVIHIQKMIKN